MVDLLSRYAETFRGTQPCGTRTWIAFDFGRVRHARPSGEKAIIRGRRALRRVTRAARRSGAVRVQILFDDAVFQRMERHDCETALAGKHARRRFEPALKFAKLVIHMDAQRLERERRGMDRI